MATFRDKFKALQSTGKIGKQDASDTFRIKRLVRAGRARVVTAEQLEEAIDALIEDGAISGHNIPEFSMEFPTSRMSEFFQSLISDRMRARMFRIVFVKDENNRRLKEVLIVTGTFQRRAFNSVRQQHSDDLHLHVNTEYFHVVCAFRQTKHTKVFELSSGHLASLRTY